MFFFRPSPTFLVIEVTDGDTIELGDGRTIRYLNLDTPELELGERPDQCFAQEAKRINEELVLGKKVSLELDVNEMDRFGCWGKCVLDPNVGCRVKGNMDESGHHWYHLPHFRHYNQVVVNLEKANRWFCSETKAIEAGFKKAKE